MERRDLLLGACLAYATLRPLSAKTLLGVRIATVPLDAGAEFYFASDMGFFDKAGVAASVDAVTNGNAILNAVISGTVNVGYSNILSLEVAFQKGAPITIVAPAAINIDAHPTEFLFANRASAIHAASRSRCSDC